MVPVRPLQRKLCFRAKFDDTTCCIREASIDILDQLNMPSCVFLEVKSVGNPCAGNRMHGLMSGDGKHGFELPHPSSSLLVSDLMRKPFDNLLLLGNILECTTM